MSKFRASSVSNFVLISLVGLLGSVTGVFSAIVPESNVREMILGWQQLSPQPLHTRMGSRIKSIQAYSDEGGNILFYAVNLQPEGFVLTAADDRLEPIIAFSGSGSYVDNKGNPLTVLIRDDMKARMEYIMQHPSTRGMDEQTEKWQLLMDASDGTTRGSGLSAIDDMHVAPLINTHWNQSWDYSSGYDKVACYNYYTPPYAAGAWSNYPCGCTATAWAQMMKYFAWPQSAMPVYTNTIEVDGVEEQRATFGLAYDWASMPNEPNGDTPEAQRQAISRVTHDVGVVADASYTPDGTSAGVSARDMEQHFGFANVIYSYASMGVGLNITNTMNANLNAGLPVAMSLTSDAGNHAVLGDGYGYNLGTPYHHLNMGWGGSKDAWYQLSNVDCDWYQFAFSGAVYYNIYTNGTGEIVSGRVTDNAGNPMNGVAVTLSGDGAPRITNTDSNGIYAFVHVSSDTTCTLTATNEGYTFADLPVETGTSGYNTYGNLGAADLQGSSSLTLRITTTRLPNGTEMTSYSVPLNATGGVPPYVWSEFTGYEMITSSVSTYAESGNVVSNFLVTFPFEFPFYGSTYTQCWINLNGALNFTESDNSISASNFANKVCIGALWSRLHIPPGEVFVATSSSFVKIRWFGYTFCDSAYITHRFSATLKPDGEIVLAYDGENRAGGTICASSGNGKDYVVSSRTNTIANSDDIILQTVSLLPQGISLSASGLLSGRSLTKGTNTFSVQVTDSFGSSDSRDLSLVTAGNTNQWPVIDLYVPTNTQYEMYAAYTQEFYVAAHDPEGNSLTYRWLRDGVLVSTTESYSAQTAWTNGGDSWGLRCYVSDDLWTNHVCQDWSVTVKTDNDGDGMPNVYETNYPGVLNPWIADGTNDYDSDFADNLTEYQNGTCPTNRDTNGDDLSDGWQIRYGSDPLSSTGGLAGLDLRLAGACNTPGNAHGVFVSGDYAYIADYSSGLQLIDVNSPTHPVLVGSYDTVGCAFDVFASGDFAYVADDSGGLQVLEVNDQTNLVLAGSYDTQGQALGIYKDENYVYVANYQNGLQVIDVTHPTNLVSVAECRTLGAPFNVCIMDDYAYVADTWEGLRIINVSSPTNPTFVSVYNTVGDAWNVHVQGHYVYVAEHSFGLQIIDVSNVSSPTLAGNYDTPSYAQGVYVSGDYAYVADAYSGLQVVDVSNPGDPVFAGSYDTPSSALDVFVNGNYIFVADGYSGLQIIENKGLLDSDQDGMLDSWEMTNFSNLNQAATGDFDGDGIWNIGEYHGNLDPTKDDQDGDGLNDGSEVDTYNSTPTRVDSDYDGLSDPDEVNGVNGYQTKAYDWDSDGDGASDVLEPLIGRNPLDASDGGPVSSLGGMITGAGGTAVPYAKVRLYDTAHKVLASTITWANGQYQLNWLQSGDYRVKVDADGYRSQWYNAKTSFDDADAYHLPTNVSVTNLNFALVEGQLASYAFVTSEVAGAEIYLDYQDTGKVTPAVVSLGQSCATPGLYTPASHFGLFYAASHTVTLKKDGQPLSGVQSVQAEQADTVTVEFSAVAVTNTGAVAVDSQPQGASVYLDYMDNPVGVTPITITNLEAASHTVVLAHTNALQPMPISVGVEAGGTRNISIPLYTPGEGTNIHVLVTSNPTNVPLYLDYLPAAKVTDAVLDTLDAASHAGAGWRSVSHTVMLIGEQDYHSLPYWVPSDATSTQQIHIELFGYTGSGKQSQSIMFQEIPVKMYGDSFDPGASASSGLSVSYAISDSAVATNAGSMIYVIGTGVCNVVASQAGNSNYWPAASITNVLVASAKSLTVTGATAQDKIYDGTDAAVIIGAGLSGVVAGDDVSLLNASAGIFAQANIGNGIAVSSAMSLGGNDIKWYILSSQPVLSANITAKGLTVIGAAAQNKEYDGTTAALITGGSLNGVVGSDDVILANASTGTFATASVGTGIAVTSYMTLTGSAGGNYTVSQPTLSADIIKRTQTITFAQIPQQIVTNIVLLNASTDSSLPLTYRVISGSAQINGVNLTFSYAGNVSVLCSQAGDATWKSTAVTNSFAVLPLMPAVVTHDASKVNNFSFTAGGEVTSDGQGLTTRGICWATNTVPTVNDFKTEDGSGIGTYVSMASSLQKDTVYYVRAYANNASGIVYGDEIMVTTSNRPASLEFLLLLLNE